jgi:hypothetical protein
MNDNLTWPTLDRHDDRFDSQYRRQNTTRNHTRTKGNSWNNNTSYGTPRNAWNTQALHTPTPRNTDQHNSWRTTSNPFSTSTTNQSTSHYYPFDQVNATPASIKLKDLTDIASVQPLSTQEWNQYNSKDTVKRTTLWYYRQQIPIYGHETVQYFCMGKNTPTRQKFPQQLE